MKEYRRYTLEEDDAIRALTALPHGSRARFAAYEALVERYGRTDAAIATRARYLATREGATIRYRNRTPFSTEEDDLIKAVPRGTSERDWEKLSNRLDRPILTMKHRRLTLERETEKPPSRPAVDLPLPAASPSWFERPITRDRLMAGR